MVGQRKGIDGSEVSRAGKIVDKLADKVWFWN